MMGNGQTQSGFMPYTILTRPSDYFQDLNFYVKDGVDMKTFLPEIARYVAKIKGRPVTDIMTQSVVEQMGSVDSVLGGMSAAVGGIAAISLLVGGIRDGAYPGDRNQEGSGGPYRRYHDAVFDRVGAHVGLRRRDRNSAGSGDCHDRRKRHGDGPCCEGVRNHCGGRIFRPGWNLLWPVSGIQGGKGRSYRCAAL